MDAAQGQGFRVAVATAAIAVLGGVAVLSWYFLRSFEDARRSDATVNASHTRRAGDNTAGEARSDAAPGGAEPTQADAATSSTTIGAATPAAAAPRRGLLSLLATADENPVPPGPAATCSIAGVVLDADGLPLARVEVVASTRPDQGMQWAVPTEADGIFHIVTLPPGAYSLEVRVVDFTGNNIPPEPLALTLAADEAKTGVELRCTRGEEVTGTVRDTDGKPIEAAKVQAYIQNGNQWRLIEATTDAEGGYAMVGLPSATPIIAMLAQKEGFENGQRSQIYAAESPIDFTLTPLARVTLVVVDAMTRAPILGYRYQVNVRSSRGGTRSIVPWELSTASDGRTELPPLSTGLYEVVVEAAASASGGGRRGFENLGISEGVRPPDEVVVALGGLRAVEGIVSDKDAMKPVGGLRVGLVADAKPAEGTTNIAWQHTATSDAAGRFRIEEVADGRYFAGIDEGDYIQFEDVWIELTSSRTPEPLSILVTRPGAMVGRVLHASGEPIAQARLWARQSISGAEQKLELQATTDASGEYRFDGLRPALYYVLCQLPVTGIEKHREIEVLGGQEEAIDFVFDDLIHLTGSATVDYAPWEGNPPLRLYAAGNEVPRVFGSDHGLPLRLTGSGAFEATTPAGDYFLWAFGSSNRIAVVEPIALAPEPLEQDRILAIALADLTIEAITEAGDSFSAGRVTIDQRVEGHELNRLFSWPMDSEVRIIDRLPVGEYRAVFSSADGMWEGRSDWTRSERGADNTLRIELKRSARGDTVGRWSPETITTLAKPHYFDVTPYLAGGGGTFEAVVLFENGFHGVWIEKATLLHNGAAEGQDVHIGWSGYGKHDNIYRLPVTGFDPVGRYLLEVVMRSDGGTESQGSVLWRPSGD